MKTKIILSIISFFCVHLIFAQYSLQGSITNPIGEPIPYANIILIKKEHSKFIKGGISNNQGKFLLDNIQKGEYLLQINSLGYKEIEKQLIIVDKDIDFAAIQLEEASYGLDEVVIKTQKPILEQKNDRLTVNVEGSLIGTSGNALEILERLPGVEVSSDGTSLTLNGKSEVGVLINNKLTRVPISSLLQILGSTNGTDIKSIDLIANPSSKYDAEFTGGLININQIKKNTEGTNGNILLGLGYGDGDKQKAGVNWNTRKGKVNFYGNANFDRNDNPRKYTNSATIIDGETQIFNKTISNRNPIITGYSAQLGLDYYINDKITLGALLNGNRSRYQQEVSGNGVITETPGEKTTLNIINTEDSKRDLITSNITLGVKLDSLNTIDFDVDYLNYYNENPTDYDNTFFDPQGNITSNEYFLASKNTPVNVWGGKTNYSKKLTNSITFQLGGKYTHSSLDNTVNVQDLDNGVLIQNQALSEKSSLKENISAAYSSLDWKINEKINLNVGLRYEYSTQDLTLESNGNVLDTEVSELFPSLFISQQLKNQSVLQFSYGRRITRPTYFDLAPFLLFLDPNTFFNGNINLKPSISNSMTVNYKYKKYLASLQFTNEDNAIARKQPVLLQESGQQVITSLNLEYLNTYSLNLTVPIRIAHWWYMDTTFHFAFLEQELNKKRSDDTYFSLKTSQNFNITEDLHLQLYASYNSERLVGVRNIDDFQRVNMSIEKKMKKWGSKIQLSYTDIFGKNLSFNTTEQFNTSFFKYEYEPRVLRITFTHNFGNSKVKKQRKRETSTKEIKKRIR